MQPLTRIGIALAIPAVWFAVGRGGAAVLQRGDGEASESAYNQYRQLKLVLVAWALVVVAFLVSGTTAWLAGDGVANAVAVLGDTALGALLASLAILGLAEGQRPVTRVRRDAGLTPPDWARTLWWAGVVPPAALFAATYNVWAYRLLDFGFAWLLGAFFLAVHLKYVLSQVLNGGSIAVAGPDRIHDPDPDQRERIERARADGDVEPGWVQVVSPPADADDGAGWVVGNALAGMRTLVVHEAALDDWDDDQLGVAVAAVTERNRHGFLAYRAGYVAVLVLLATLTMDAAATLQAGAGLDAATLGAFAVGPVLVVAFASLSRRSVCRGDAAARDRFGADAVAAVYDSLGEHIDKKPDNTVPLQGVPVLSALSTYISPFPMLESRLAVVRDGVATGDETAAD